MTVLLLAVLLGSWTESFETQAYFPPDDWLVVNEDVLDGWWFRTGLDGNTGTHAATCYAEYATYLIPNSDWLITPRVLPEAGDTVLEFASRTTGTGPCTLEVLVAPVCSMPAFEVLQTLALEEPAWAQHSLSLGGQSGSPTYVAFRVRYIPSDGQVWLDDISLPALAVQPELCNGCLRVDALEAETATVQHRVQCWGTHYDMGFAQGFLLAEEGMAVFERWLIGNPGQHCFSPAAWDSTVLPYFLSRFTVPHKYQDEAEGMLDGIRAKGVSLFHPALGREMTLEDVECAQAVSDLVGSVCSSVSGWGESTIRDDTLQGGTVIARNLDWPPSIRTTLGNASLIVAYAPEVPGEQRLVSVNIAGGIGVMSGVNASGLGTCRNAENHADTGSIAPGSLVPLTESLRDLLERVDPDGNGVSDIFDVASMLACSTVRRPVAEHLFSPHDSLRPIPCGVLEINNVFDSMRLVEHNGLTPDSIASGWNLALTNHYRVLYPPEYCSRYGKLADSLNVDIRLSTERAVRLSRAVNQGGYTQQNMVFRPNVLVEHPDWPFLGVSYAWRGWGAHTRDMLWYSWDELFDGVPGVEEPRHPQRVQRAEPSATVVRGVLRVGREWLAGSSQLELLDACGRRMMELVSGANDIRHLAPGVYFVRSGLSAVSGAPLAVRKVVVTR